ncbi:MAG: Gfo/Idh/MocA family oxidoreductase [Planctomycetota bacterium]
MPKTNETPATSQAPATSAQETHGSTRRTFIKGTTAAGITAALASTGIGTAAFAQGDDTVKVGLVGCGGRGTGAAYNAIEASSGVVLHAMGDLYEDRLNGSANNLEQNTGEAFQVGNRKFTGFDAYQEVINADVDLCIFATPPYFRPQMVKAAVDAGKHVFFEKPVAVDPAGCRLVMEAGDIANQKGLGMVCGTQRRHQKSYVDAMAAIHDGAIGEVVGAQVFWNQGGLWNRGRQESWSNLDWQLRNWLYFTWLSGDHIVEQHIHNIDVALWAFGDVAPVKAYGNGGRQQRTGEEWGHGNDHFSLQIQMPGRFGHFINSHCRQIPGCDNYVGEEIIGSEGYARMGGTSTLVDKNGERIAQFTGGRDPYVQEHADLVASFRAGEPLNEAHRIAQSTLTAIICREAAYSGKNVSYEWALNESNLKLGPGNAPGCYTDGFSLEDFDTDVATPPVYIPGAYQTP